MKICVIKGGFSKERDVSLVSGKTLEKSVTNLDHELISFDLTSDNILQMILMFQSQKPDLIINALHGTFGEDGTIQGIFEAFKIPYSSSGILASALAMDKIKSKYIYEALHLTTPRWKKCTFENLKEDGTNFQKPFIMKPISEGSSIGVFLIKNDTDFKAAIDAWEFGDEVLLEQYIEGREMTVSLLDDDVLGVAEVISQNAFSDYEAKYTEELEQRLIPAPITKAQEKEISTITKNIKNALGCTGLTRTDFIFDGKDFYLLELNTQPGFTPTSFSILKAQQRGWSVDELVQRIIKSALSHHKLPINQKNNYQLKNA